MGRLQSVYRSKLPPLRGVWPWFSPCLALPTFLDLGPIAAPLSEHGLSSIVIFCSSWHWNWFSSIRSTYQSKWWFMNLSGFVLILNWAILEPFVIWFRMQALKLRFGFLILPFCLEECILQPEWFCDLDFLLAINYKEERIDRSNTAYARWRIELEVTWSRLFHCFTPFHFVMRQVASLVSLVLF